MFIKVTISVVVMFKWQLIEKKKKKKKKKMIMMMMMMMGRNRKLVAFKIFRS